MFSNLYERTSAFFSPPTFSDKEKTRKAALLNIVLLISIFIVAIYIISGVALGTQAIDLITIILVILIVLWLGLRRGYFKIAGWAALLIIWSLITAIAWLFGGVRDGGYISYVPLILFAGLMFGVRASVMVALASIVSGFLFAYAEENMLISAQLDTPYQIWLDQTLNFVLSTLIFVLTLRSLQQALATSHHNEQALANINNNLKIQEEQLAASEARLRAIIDQIPFDLWVCDTQGHYVVQNAISFNLAGDLTGKTVDDLDLPPNKRDEYKQKHLRALSGKTEREEIEVVIKGQHRILDSIQVPVHLGEEIIGFIGMQIDITERKQAEAAQEAYTKELERSNRDLQDFAYAASHDLQEPLRKIQTFGNRLKSRYADTLDDRGHDYIDRMENAATRMHILIEDLLTFSRVTTKAQPFSAVNLGTIVNNVLSDLEARIEDVEGQVEVRQLPIVQADKTQMRQLFQNLISNALKFHRQGVSPIVTISNHSPPNSQFCQISVTDNGIGFKEEYAERIFGIFQRLHGRETYPGTGVGLAVCKKIVDRHGGTITAQSKPGQGATFTISLPVADTPLKS